MMLILAVDMQAFCGDSFPAVSADTASVNDCRSNFAAQHRRAAGSLFVDGSDSSIQQMTAEVARSHHHSHRLHQQLRSSPGADDDAAQQQGRPSSPNHRDDVDLSPADVDDSDSMQVDTHTPHCRYID